MYVSPYEFYVKDIRITYAHIDRNRLPNTAEQKSTE